MIISWNWLGKYTDTSGLDPIKASVDFTLATAEIEEVIEPPKKEFLDQFLVAEVQEVVAHPNASKLSCCKVYDGSEILDIVCGASNVRPGLKTILAPIGAQLGDFKIKKAKLRGEPSHGMLCSETELGVGSDDTGIIELNGYAAGTTAGEVYTNLPITWDLDNKAITHRPDLWGHHGLSRELASIYGRKLSDLELVEIDGQGNDGYEININNYEVCRRYCGLSVGNIKVQDSPEWMQKLLAEVGLKPINNVVDATNFVMLEMGQPSHAFDAAKLLSKKISVDFAQAGESFTTLTEKEIELNTESLLIRSGDTGVALAGVMGGLDSSVSEDTNEIFLEAAHFAPVCVRKTAQKFDLRTDSSARFEKSLDPENAPKALRRIVTLLKETCPDLQIKSEIIDQYPAPIPSLEIDLDPQYVNGVLGCELDSQTQENILVSLGFVLEANDSGWKVKVPTYRNTKDIEGAIDLVEEIGRVYGYDKIEPVSPVLKLESVQVNPKLEKIKDVQDTLVKRGYSEVMTYSFMSADEMSEHNIAEDDALEIANPLTKEYTHMRTSILPRAIDTWKLNTKNLEKFKMFEFGKVFHKSDKLLPKETDELICSVYGDSEKGELLYSLKDDVLNLLENLGINDVVVEAAKSELPLAHAARCGVFKQNEVEVGYIAELHPNLAKKYGIRKRLSFCVIYDVLNLKTKGSVSFSALEKFPPVPFSVSLIVDKKTTAGEVLKLIQNVNPDLIRDLHWVENYSGSPIPEDKISMTVAMNFRNPERTMQGEEIQKLQDEIVEVAAGHNYLLREG